jgi:hypothetical protein
MALLLHITIALSSIIYNALIYFSPTKSRLNAAYGLVALTIASGSYLVWSTKANLVRTCLSGLLFVGVSFYGIAIARNKLEKATSQINK